MAIVFRFVSCNTQCVLPDMHDTRCYRQESLPSVNDALRWLLNRRRSFAELVAAVWRVCGIDGQAGYRNLPVKRYGYECESVPSQCVGVGLAGSTYSQF